MQKLGGRSLSFQESDSRTGVEIASRLRYRALAIGYGLSAVRLLDHAVDVDRTENRGGILISEDNHTITPW